MNDLPPEAIELEALIRRAVETTPPRQLPSAPEPPPDWRTLRMFLAVSVILIAGLLLARRWLA